MRIETYATSDAFLDRYSGTWLRDEASSGILLRYRRGVDEPGVLRLAVLDDDARVPLTAVVSVDDQIVLSPGIPDAVARLAAWLNSQGVPIPGIFASRPTSLQFAEQFGRINGVRFVVAKELLHHELHELECYTSSPGRFRAATAADEAVLVQFAEASQAEGNTQRRYDASATVTRDLAEGALYVWETNQDGVVAAGGIYLDRSPRSGYVDGVYTRPDHRGHGFATSLVGELTRRILDAGRVPSLSVDSGNQAAIRTYEKLGYAAICRMDNLRRYEAASDS